MQLLAFRGCILEFSSNQARPNPMSTKLHRFATKNPVCDLFALGLEQFESTKTGQGQNNISKRKYFKKIVHFVLSNLTQSLIT